MEDNAMQSIARAGFHLLTLRQVKAKTNLGRSSIYAGVRNGSFPAPIKPYGTCSRWIEEEVDKFVALRISERDAMKSAA